MYSTVPQNEYVLESNASLLRPKSVGGEREREKRRVGVVLYICAWEEDKDRGVQGWGAEVASTKEQAWQGVLTVRHWGDDENRQREVINCDDVGQCGITTNNPWNNLGVQC